MGRLDVVAARQGANTAARSRRWRGWAYKPVRPDEFHKGYVYQWPRSTEEELRAELAEDGRNHKYVVPGGAWWKHTQQAIAEMAARRAGDTKRLEEIEVERKADWEAFERGLL